MDDIKNFADLKKVAEDITARRDELGFDAFTSAGMDGSSDWRFKSIRQTESTTQRQSRAHTWITTVRSGICTLITQQQILSSSVLRPVMMQSLSS